MLHVQLGESAPCAADGIEGPAAAFHQPIDARDRLIDERQRLVDLVAGLIDEAQAAERQCRGVVEAVVIDVDDLEAAAAEIAGKTVGIEEAHADAVSGELGFLLARQDLNLGAGSLLGPGDEIVAILRLAHGGGGDGAQVLDLENSRDGAEAA